MKIGVVGCGQVGSASAYACVLGGVGTGLVLVDKNEALAIAQVEDISHATPFAKSMPVTAGSYDALAECGIVMIAAGANQKPGETRLDLLARNAAIFAEIIPKVVKAVPDAILLVASNPVDIMTHVAARIAQESGYGPERVIGSGTILDTARFRTLLARHLNVSSHSVHAYVLGEHGDSEVLNWSSASVSGVSLSEFSRQISCDITPDIVTRIDEGVRKAAYRIIQGKGATWYGIGAGMARIARAITEDEHSILTCSTPLASIVGVEEVTISLPRIISARGIERTIYPTLDTKEEAALKRSADILKAATSSLGF